MRIPPKPSLVTTGPQRFSGEKTFVDGIRFGDGTSQTTAGGGGGGGSGGYMGTWAAGTYAAGSIVKRGPFVWGTTTSTSADPCETSDLGSVSDWTPRGVATQSGTMLALTGGFTGQMGAGFRTSTISGWNGKRIICDAFTSSGADGLHFGLYDSSLTTSPTFTGTGLVGVTGFYGVQIDIFNAVVKTVLNGVQGNSIALPSGTTNVWSRWILDLTDNGANWTMKLWRQGWLSNSTDPGLVTTWTVAKPSFTSWRPAVGAWTGGVAGTFKVRSFYAYDRSGPWSVLSVLPHSPQIDQSIW